MKSFEEEMTHIVEDNRHEVERNSGEISSRIDDLEGDLQSLSENFDNHVDVNSSMIENIYKLIFVLERKLREHGVHGDEGEEGDDSHRDRLMEKIPDERRSYVLENLHKIVISDNKTDRIILMSEVLSSGKSNSDETDFIFEFVDMSGELTERGVKERVRVTHKPDGPGFEI